MTPAQLGPGGATVGRRLRWWDRPPLEAAVLSGTVLAHYRRLADRPDRPWVRLGTISEHASGPAELALVDGVLTVRVAESSGHAHYRLEGGDWLRTSASAWVPPAPPDPPTAAELGVPAASLRAVAAFASDWPQALADEDGSVFGYHRTPDGRWLRSSCLRIAEGEHSEAANSSVKLAQVTGELDATPTPWGERRPTLSRSESSAGVRGTDLGVRFEHAGRSFLLFGDTHWRRRPWLATRDSIAEVVPGDGLPRVRFHGSPLRLDRASMREYDVPLDAFSRRGRLYGFFSADHFRDRLVMGRSVLARAVDPSLPIDPAARRSPIRFQVLATLSSHHFVNVSAQLLPASALNQGDRYFGSADGDVNRSTCPHGSADGDVNRSTCPHGSADGDVVLLWGTGPYRASEVRLAMLDAAALDRLDARISPVATDELGLRYWDGAGWADSEDEAQPLFRPGALGELSVRWVPEAGRYALLAASGPEDPIGAAVTLRWAERPWGPWTPRLKLLDWVAGGMAPDPFVRFIKASPDEEIGDRVFRIQARSTGGAYAPYLFDARREGDDLVLRYTLSTWNPYQVVLMEHRLAPGEW
jgi:hypothetical protein